jgi:N6-adenosine-specific RNA methylase IME4
MKINEVKINEGRRVTDQKKIKELADSIKELGLLNPITVNEDGTLIAGMHRLEACKLLGYEEIKVNKINLSSLLAELAEIDENLVRNELHWLESDKQLRRRKAIYEELHPETKHNSKFKGNQFRSSEIISSDQKTFTEDTADKLGQSQRNIQMSVARAESIEDEEVIEQIKELDISKTEGTILARFEPEQQKKIIEVKKQKTDSSIKEIVQEIKKEEKKAELQEKRQKIEEGVFNVDINNIPEKFDVIYADPPWRYDFAETDNRKIENHYTTMENSDIAKMNVPAADNCVLFMWATAPKLIEAIEVIKGWGFEYKTCAVWDKEKMGMGYWFRGQHELLMVGVKGNVSPPEASIRISSVIRESRQNHSRKPDCVAEYIELAFYDKSKIELFCREPRNGWYSFGNQI